MRLVATTLAAALAPILPAAAQIGNPAGLAPDTRFQAPGVPAPNQTNNPDRLFAQLVSAGGMAEVQFAKLAMEKASSSAVKEFAGHMIDDHTKANEKLAAIADASKIPLPDKLDPDHERILAELKKRDRAEFDKFYISSQVTDHQKTALLLEWEIDSGEDAEMQRFAAGILPKVLDHLRMAREIQAELARQASAR
jgi:putative membrane protein